MIPFYQRSMIYALYSPAITRILRGSVLLFPEFLVIPARLDPKFPIVILGSFQESLVLSFFVQL